MSENKPDPQERKVRVALAHALWTVEKGSDAPKGEEAKVAFKAARAELITKSSKIIRKLERQGITLTASDDMPEAGTS